ncbi:uncharacterized protein LACBIDRAFT_330348 [Laccaria bicolor S238N-H82]|uniref:Predicted protein n=1 Tax=Laccaria bicolor (strain S238N-H82 / ATCC MYA-4686) TaxID=486041 RepID=B0DL09_LACBS|nr:uncharacterized protein LACBIDRAFT_330348 [Laccaria bicolor S238N-H82]EDR04830.1 predicted protein [Laccaria bicolor S238N-H82]|eukprot:XP_001884654.1 predicted protein [Laccaria bicolor S238N-H82]
MTQHPWVAHVEFIEEAFRRQIHKTPRRRPTNNQQPARYQSFDVIPICHTVVFGVVQCAPAYLSIVFIDLLSTRSDMHEQLALHLISLRLQPTLHLCAADVEFSEHEREIAAHETWHRPGICVLCTICLKLFINFLADEGPPTTSNQLVTTLWTHSPIVWRCVAKASDDEWLPMDDLDTFPGTSILYAGCQQVQSPLCGDVEFIDLGREIAHKKPGIGLQSARYHSMDPFMFGVVWQRLRMTNAFNATLDALDTFPGTSILYAGCQQVQCAPAYLSIVFIDLLSARSHMHEQLALHPPHLTLFAANCSVKSRNEFSHKL